jgi:hypothetical protein
VERLLMNNKMLSSRTKTMMIYDKRKQCTLLFAVLVRI